MSLEPMIDPDCRDPYKHGTCAGAPCQCPCHGTTPPVAAGPALPGGCNGTVLPPLPSTPLDQNPVCPACGGTLALERHRVVCLSDEVNHYWYWDGSDD